MDAPTQTDLTTTTLSRAVEISKAYASGILSGKKALPQALAIRIFRATGHKLGVIAHATDDEIAVLERFQQQPQLDHADVMAPGESCVAGNDTAVFP